MRELLDELIDVRSREMLRGNREHFEYFHSNHEGYAVLLEEMDEALTEMRRADSMLHNLWESKIKTDSSVYDNCRVLEKTLLNLSAEALQASAMAHKMMMSELYRKGTE